MKVVLFCHSLLSDWNHGNAHFLRGVLAELERRGHETLAFEPEDAWSFRNLEREGSATARRAIARFREVYPDLRSVRYDPDHLDLDRALDGADLVLVHEWSDPGVVARIGLHRSRNPGYVLLFHDTHHRGVSRTEEIDALDLGRYDGVLAFGEVLRERYLERGWGRRVWTWHEAADARVFGPLHGREEEGADGDVVWIGNWGDDERSAELREFLLHPVRDLGARGRVHGVRYPPEALEAVRSAGLEYGGWLPNLGVPEVFARFLATVHVPRRPYVEILPGIPTIRPFEALACGIPLVSAPWDDTEGLFTPGEDFLVATDGEEMRSHLRALIRDADLRRALSRRGRETVLARHTCAHRVDELLEIRAAMAEAPAEERAEDRAEDRNDGRAEVRAARARTERTPPSTEQPAWS